MKALHIIGLILKGILFVIWFILQLIGILVMSIFAPEYVLFKD